MQNHDFPASLASIITNYFVNNQIFIPYQGLLFILNGFNEMLKEIVAYVLVVS